MVENTGVTLWLERLLSGAILLNFILCLIRSEACFCPQFPSFECTCYRVDVIGRNETNLTGRHNDFDANGELDPYVRTLDGGEIDRLKVR
jgi:hypothetical protein